MKIDLKSSATDLSNIEEQLVASVALIATFKIYK